MTVHKGTRGYSGRSKRLDKLKAIGQRIEMSWREPHYEFNGLSAEEAVDHPIDDLVKNRLKGEETEPANDHERERIEARRRRLLDGLNETQ